jgi:hypothetical protein
VSSGRLLVGVLLGALALVPVCAGARALRRSLLRGWSGPPAWLADVVLGLSIIVCTCELLGVVGGFRLAAMVPALAVAGGTAWYAGRRFAPSEMPGFRGVPQQRLAPGASFAALGAAAIVVAEWCTRTIDALRHGPTGIDTLWYHLPVAARFVQEGSIVSAHYTDTDLSGLAASFPSNTALLHGLGIMFLGSDLLSPVLNTGFLALALLSAWCIGRPFGVGAASVVCVAVVLATPSLVATQPGGAYSDVAGIALVLAAGALLLNGGAPRVAPHLRVIVIAALAAGLVVGSKYQFLAPVVALTIGVVAISQRGTRVRRGITWLLFVGLTGGFWYVRNLVLFDNPVPPLGIDLGPLNLPSPPELATEQARLVEFVLDGQAWSDHLLPGLSRAFGPVWWAVLALGLAGIVVGTVVARRCGGAARVVAFVAIAGVVGFLVTPVIHNVGGEPAFFANDLRYATLPLALGAVLLPLAFSPSRAWWPLAIAGAVLVATQLDASIWPSDVRDERLVQPVRGAASVGGLVVGIGVLLVGIGIIRIRMQRPQWRPPFGAVVLLGVGVLAGALVVQDSYLENRYMNTPPTPELYAWAHDIRDERIALEADLLFFQYPFYGNDLSNHVQYISERRPHGLVRPIFRCVDWRRALNAGRFTYVVVATGLKPPNAVFRRPDPYTLWTDTDPSTTLVQREISNLDQYGDRRFGSVGYSLYRIDAPLDPSGCAALEGDRQP